MHPVVQKTLDRFGVFTLNGKTLDQCSSHELREALMPYYRGKPPKQYTRKYSAMVHELDSRKDGYDLIHKIDRPK